jgi:hypothetical protein
MDKPTTNLGKAKHLPIRRCAAPSGALSTKESIVVHFRRAEMAFCLIQVKENMEA